MIKSITYITAFISTLVLSSSLFSQNHYVVQSPDGEAHLLTIDISDGTQVDSIGVQFVSTTDVISGFNGMAVDPISGDIYVAVRSNSSIKYLGTLDPTTGNVTIIGITNMNPSSITFDSNGTLYAMAGQGSTELYTLNTTNAASTLFHTFTDGGDDGETIGYNSNDGLLYRYDGGASGNLITLNLSTLAESTVGTLSGIDTWGGALYFNPFADDFTFAAGESFYNLKTDGTVTALGDITSLGYSGNFKGIVKVNQLTNTITPPSTGSLFSVYPNPSSGQFEIIADVPFELEILDVNGSILETYSNKTDISIDRSGVYFFRFIEGDARTVKKVVVL